MSYLGNLILGADLFASALLGGIPGETLSGRAGGALLEGKLRGKIFAPPIDVFMHLCGQFPTWRGHCVHAVADDVKRARAVIADDERLGPPA